MGSGITLIMVVLELLDQGMNTLSKAAMVRGMSNFVFVVYSNALGFFILLPTCFFFHRSCGPIITVFIDCCRKNPPPTLTLSILFRIFLLSTLGCCLQLLLWVGIGYSSPILASVMTDLTPAFTFIFAIISRMERLDLRACSSLAKLIGTIVSITGALVVTLYKGLPLINYSSSNMADLDLPSSPPQSTDWVFGGFLLACAAFLLSLLFIVQTWTVREYPAEMMMALIGCIFIIIESTSLALIVERGRPEEVWTLKPGIELILIVYSAFFSAIRNIASARACRAKGPLFVAMFKPLGMIFATVMGVSFLGDNLYLGSVAGAAVIVIGFYAVIWGKSQEAESIQSPSKEPLLKTSTDRSQCPSFTA